MHNRNKHSIIKPAPGIEIWYCLISDLINIVCLNQNCINCTNSTHNPHHTNSTDSTDSTDYTNSNSTNSTYYTDSKPHHTYKTRHFYETQNNTETQNNSKTQNNLKKQNSSGKYHNYDDQSGFSVQRSVFFKKKDFIPDFLSPEEIKTINGFKAHKKQIEWIAGRFLIKKMVQKLLHKTCISCQDSPFHRITFKPSKASFNPSIDQQSNYKTFISSKKNHNYYNNIKLRDISIAYHKEGAPFLEKWPFLKISISHSGEYAAVSLCLLQNKDIGLDIEKIGAMPDSSFMKIAFTEKEIANMRHCPKEVFKKWTIKEAFLKYIKKGFNESLHNVEILDNNIFHNGNKTDVSIFSTIIGNKYALSLVSA